MRRYPKGQSVRFGFRQTPQTFFVEEIPAFDFRDKGEHLVLKVEKTGLSTWEMVDILSRHIDDRVGYAGLKDKNATTIQYISLPKRYYKSMKKFRHPRIKILDTFLHNRPLKIGDLSANRFIITLQNPSSNLANMAKEIAQKGVPNYFGYQRFGKKSLEQARALIEGEYFTKDRRLANFLLKSYQSHLFNLWLAHRVGLDDAKFKRLSGDIYLGPKGYFASRKILEDQIPTGLLPGSRVPLARGDAREIEALYDERIPLKGDRRAALFFPRDLKIEEAKDRANLEFILPKGSYATIFLENLAQKELDFKGTE